MSVLPHEKPKHFHRIYELFTELEAFLYQLLASHPRPAKSLLLVDLEANRMSTSAFALVAGGPPILVQLVPLPAGSIFASPADLELTADDPEIVIEPNPGDTTGSQFLVSAPESDPGTTFNLDATGLAPGANPGDPPVQISGTQQVTVAAVAPPPPPAPATSIGFQMLDQATSASPATTAAATAVPAAGKQRAAVKK
jgi:hypothetical protein